MAVATSTFSGQVTGNSRRKTRYRGRRGNNEGMIRLRSDGRWEGRVSVAGEKRKSYFGHKREDVARQVSVALRDLQKGIGPIRDERLTVARFLQDWIACVRLDVRTNSFFYDEQMVRLHIAPRLGRIALARLSPAHVRKCLDDLLETDLSSTTVRHVHDVLHTALEYAVDNELVQRNVADAVTPPRRAEHEMQVLTSDQAKLLLQAAEGQRLYALFAVALSTGMRQGELLALRWRDVDLKWKTIQVQATLDRHAARSAAQGLGVIGRDGEFVHARGPDAARIMRESNLFAPPKSKRSRRQIQLSKFAVKVLRTHQACQVDERMTAGDSWSDLDLVFPNQAGRPLDPSNVRRREFQPLLAKAGLPRIRFHDLRHTAATLLLQQRVNPKIVSEMLGHASISITLDLYSHALPDIQQESAAAMDAVFGSD